MLITGAGNLSRFLRSLAWSFCSAFSYSLVQVCFEIANNLHQALRKQAVI
jgi:hypothetical protein